MSHKTTIRILYENFQMLTSTHPNWLKIVRMQILKFTKITCCLWVNLVKRPILYLNFLEQNNSMKSYHSCLRKLKKVFRKAHSEDWSTKRSCSIKYFRSKMAHLKRSTLIYLHHGKHSGKPTWFLTKNIYEIVSTENEIRRINLYWLEDFVAHHSFICSIWNRCSNDVWNQLFELSEWSCGLWKVSRKGFGRYTKDISNIFLFPINKNETTRLKTGNFLTARYQISRLRTSIE